VEAFSVTLALDLRLLRGLRHALTTWLDGAGATPENRDSIVLATHEATAHAMEIGESGTTVDVTAIRDNDDSFVLHVRSDGGWTASGSAVESDRMVMVRKLMSDVSTQSSSTVRMRQST
jgi:histidine kinase-like protein